MTRYLSDQFYWDIKYDLETHIFENVSFDILFLTKVSSLIFFIIYKEISYFTFFFYSYIHEWLEIYVYAATNAKIILEHFAFALLFIL